LFSSFHKWDLGGFEIFFTKNNLNYKHFLLITFYYSEKENKKIYIKTYEIKRKKL